MLFGLLKDDVFTGETRDFGADTPPDISHKSLEWRAFRRDPAPVFDPAIEKLGPETFTVEPTEIVASHAVVTLTQTELDGRDKNKIVGAMLDLGFILIKLSNVLISKGVIVAGDFDAETRQEYLDLKAIVTRLRS
ncbi:MAG: hypothetical protein V3S55_06445 [Nitrospiraceae bacterium]